MNRFNKNYIFIVSTLVLSIILTAYITNKVALRNSTVKTYISDVNIGAGGENNREACTDSNLMLDKLPQHVKENQNIINLLRKECSFVTDSFQRDINSDGNDEIFMQTTSLFCGNASCKDRTVYILSSGETLFYSSGYDMKFERSTTPGEFAVTEQIKYWGEPPCCSSKRLAIRYRYSQTSTKLFEPVTSIVQ